MLKETKNRIAASFQESIKAIKEEIKGIDEKYKKLADEEKKELKEMLEYYKDQRNNILEGKNIIIVEKPEPELVETVTKEVIAEVHVEDEDEGEVVDTIFPDNNEADSEEEAEPEKTEEAVKEPAEPVSENPMDNIWPEGNTEEESEEETETSGDSDEDEWPEYVEEWQNGESK